jgi:tRNA pseudouridine13 synthase
VIHSAAERDGKDAWVFDPARSTGPPCAVGRIRAAAEDFRVDEVLGFEPDGHGDHAYLRVRKRDTNTEWLARQLARLAGVRSMDVGYAGLKDRRAVTTQWFSVCVAGRDEPDWRQMESDEVQVLEVARHARKLRRGALAGNTFEITVRELSGDRAAVEGRLARIAIEGVPNYFGEQRFGRGGANLERARAMFDGRLGRLRRHERSLYLSAARSWLFNLVVERRVEDGSWNRPLPGEVLMLDGTSSVFNIDEPDDEIRRRVDEQDIHPTGPLWGRGPLLTRGACRALEESVLAAQSSWRRGLEAAGLEQARRALRLRVRELGWAWLNQHSLVLRFELPAGGYATGVLREAIEYDASGAGRPAGAAVE